MPKRLACKLGIHSVYHDNVGERIIAGKTEMWFWKTYEVCNYCEYRQRIS